MFEKMKQVNSRGEKEEKIKLNAEYPPNHSIRQWLVRQRSLIRRGKLSQQQVSQIDLLNKQYGSVLRHNNV